MGEDRWPKMAKDPRKMFETLAFSAIFWLISCVVYASTMPMDVNVPLKCRTLAVTHGVKIDKTAS
jgi:hypothetical protein